MGIFRIPSVASPKGRCYRWQHQCRQGPHSARSRWCPKCRPRQWCSCRMQQQSSLESPQSRSRSNSHSVARSARPDPFSTHLILAQPVIQLRSNVPSRGACTQGELATMGQSGRECSYFLLFSDLKRISMSYYITRSFCAMTACSPQSS